MASQNNHGIYFQKNYHLMVVMTNGMKKKEEKKILHTLHLIEFNVFRRDLFNEILFCFVLFLFDVLCKSGKNALHGFRLERRCVSHNIILAIALMMNESSFIWPFTMHSSICFVALFPSSL